MQGAGFRGWELEMVVTEIVVVEPTPKPPNFVDRQP